MDLSVSQPIPAGDASLPVADVALLVAALAARPGASATALAQAAIDAPPAAPALSLSPASGAFSDAMAARLAGWKRS